MDGRHRHAVASTEWNRLVVMLGLVSFFAMAGLFDIHERLHQVKEDGTRALGTLRLANALCEEDEHVAHTVILGNATHRTRFLEAAERVHRIAAHVRADGVTSEQRKAVDEIVGASLQIRKR